jgi:cytochrome d ubiquinol oxidase subunit I
LLVWGEKRLGRKGHFLASGALLVGSWLSGWFIVCTNAFMQHPTGHAVGPDGVLHLTSFFTFLLNPWAIAAYVHTMIAAVVTGSFVVAAVGAYYTLRGEHQDAAARFLRIGTTVGLVASFLVAFPTGDRQAKLVARHQPVALAAMEGRFESGANAGITLIGQPNVAARRLDNPVVVPGMLSFLAYGTFHSGVAGLDSFPESDWPDNIELLYYAFHVMAGLGTIFIGLMAIAAVLSWRGALATTRPVLWLLMLAFPFPYIANTAGWMTAELGRQPWIIYGILRTRDAASPAVHSGTVLFTLIGFTGIYLVLGLLFLFLVLRELEQGPGALHG